MTGPNCRFCSAPLTHTLIDLGQQPLSNAYLVEAQVKAGREPSYPLRVRVCERCWLVQADDAVPATTIFDGDYAYFSSYSESWLAHCRRYAQAAVARFGLDAGSLVIEVASNDGYLLQYFVATGVPVLGIEPTANTAEAARAKGVATEVRFFDEAAGRDLAARGIRADLMHAANVLAHVPDIGNFVAGFAHTLKPGGTVTFEFPHLLRLIEAVQFDTIYHEHFFYLSLLAVEPVLAGAGLRIYDAEELLTHGGSLRLYCAHAGEGRIGTPAVAALRVAERSAKLDHVETYAGFSGQADAVRRDFLDFLGEARRDGKRIAAYGAAAKGNTFLNFCGVTTADIACVFDRNPHKQGKLLPGSHLPILSPDRVTEVRPDYLLILPWNLAAEITEQLGFIRAWGGKFVTASPRVEILAR